MNIELARIKVSDLVKGFADNGDAGVVGYDGQLNIRPPYQREFIYKDAQRDLVIDSILKGFPINIMYWGVNEDGSYELLDGQQRTLSICKYITSGFGIKHRYFFNLSAEEQAKILDYEILVYLCKGTAQERLEWFKVINIAGAVLNDQELLNASYTGPFVTDARAYFAKPGCPAVLLGDMFVRGSSIRQDYLSEVLDWISDGKTEKYMAEHQYDADATAVQKYYQYVIAWVKSIFPDDNYRSSMKGVAWGRLYNKYHTTAYNPLAMEEKVSALMADDSVKNKSGIYSYVFTGNEKDLNLRTFSNTQKVTAFERCKGVCAKCGGTFEFKDMEGDHITPWCEGGKTELDNLQMLCKSCNRTKSNK